MKRNIKQLVPRIKYQYIRNCLVALAFLTSIGGYSQTPNDAIMMKSRESCFALIGEKGAWDHYWEGSYLRKNGTVATLNRFVTMPMIAIGVHDRVNLIVATPYVKTWSSEPNGGKFAGAQGFQDINLAMKAELINKQVGKGKMALLTTIGYATPITNYLSDYRPYSIGNGTNELSLKGILYYGHETGFYARGTGGFLWRGQTKAERDYYYNNGSYYTPWMDVPNAWNVNAVVGKWLFSSRLKLEANYIGQKSTSGDDVRKYNAGQPTNKVNFDQLGFSGQYYFKESKVKGLGVLAYYSQVVNGRNTGQFALFGIGGTYQFKI